MWPTLLVVAAEHLSVVCGTLSMPCQQAGDPCRLDPVDHKRTRGNTRLCQPMHASGRAHQSVCHSCVIRAESCEQEYHRTALLCKVSIEELTSRDDIGFWFEVTPAARNASNPKFECFVAARLQENHQTYNVFLYVWYRPPFRDNFDALLHDTMSNGDVASPFERATLAAVHSVLLSIMVASTRQDRKLCIQVPVYYQQANGPL